MLGVFAYFFFGSLAGEFAKYPFSTPQEVDGSDIIPQLKVLVYRFLDGQYPYQWISFPEWGLHYSLFPTYLPLTWMPFIIPELLDMDYRWFAIGCLLVSIAILLIRFRGLNVLNSVILAGACCLALHQLAVHRPPIFSLTVESLIAAFYLLFSLSIFTRSPYLRGAALTLCLLSRYSLVLFVPLFAIVLFMEDRRRSIVTFMIPLAGFLLIYFLPFLSKDVTIFQQGFDYHTQAAYNSWQPREWQAPTDTPDNLLKGLGLGIFFFENVEGSIDHRVDVYRRTHLILSLSSVAILTLVYLLRRRRVHSGWFLLGAFKIYLVLFFNFIQIPFHYLFLTLVTISFVMLACILQTASGLRKA